MTTGIASARETASILVFALTYLVVATGRLPGFRIDRAGAALLGASIMVALGALPLGDAYRAVDWDTIALLLGSMIVVANLRLSGAFGILTETIAGRVRHPLALLALVVLLSGVSSAFLVNDTICLVLAPLVLELTLGLDRPPLPYLLALAMASNVGSAATITGNPQNVMIGSFSHIGYGAFATVLALPAAAGLAVVFVTTAVAFRREFFVTAFPAQEVRRWRYHRGLAIKAVMVALVMIVTFFLVEPPAKPALLAGSVLLLTRRVKPQRVYREIDWGLLVMFVGLFVVVAGFERVVLGPELIAQIASWHLDEPAILTVVTVVLSNLVSNVPAVLVLHPFVDRLADPHRSWLLVAMASTFAGNLTVLGSVANLIVLQRADARGVKIGFWLYLALGLPVTVITLVIGVVAINSLS